MSQDCFNSVIVRSAALSNNHYRQRREWAGLAINAIKMERAFGTFRPPARDLASQPAESPLDPFHRRVTQRKGQLEDQVHQTTSFDVDYEAEATKSEATYLSKVQQMSTLPGLPES